MTDTKGIQDLVTEFDRSLARGERPAIRDYLPRLDASGSQRDLATSLLSVEACHDWRPPHFVDNVRACANIFTTDDLRIQLARRVYVDLIDTGYQPSLDDFQQLGPGANELDLRYRPHEHALGDELGLMQDGLGRYVIDSRLGSGGFGVVYRAADRLGGWVAIKHITPRQPATGGLADTMALDELATEALHDFRMIREIGHEHIVPVFDAFPSGLGSGSVYVVMQFVPGGSLIDLLRQRRRDPGREPAEDWYLSAAKIVWRVAETLHFAHTRGVIHRDIKPANILLTEEGGPMISDFGLAEFADRLAMGNANVAGTLAYMSPEQRAGRELDGRSDLFSLGLVLFELLSGTRPDRPALKTSDPLNGAPTTLLRELKADIPYSMEEVCLRVLATRPDDRPVSGGEFAEDLLWSVEQTDHAPPYDPAHRYQSTADVAARLLSLCSSVFKEKKKVMRGLLRLAAYASRAYVEAGGGNQYPFETIVPSQDANWLAGFCQRFAENSVGSPGQAAAIALDSRNGRLVFSDPQSTCFPLLVALHLHDRIAAADVALLRECEFVHDIHENLAVLIRHPSLKRPRTSRRVLRQLRDWLVNERQPSFVRGFSAWQLGCARSWLYLDELHATFLQARERSFVFGLTCALGRIKCRRSLDVLDSRIACEADADLRAEMQTAYLFIQGMGNCPDYY